MKTVGYGRRILMIDKRGFGERILLIVWELFLKYANNADSRSMVGSTTPPAVGWGHLLMAFIL